jgi:hypothetical protein
MRRNCITLRSHSDLRGRDATWLLVGVVVGVLIAACAATVGILLAILIG